VAQVIAAAEVIATGWLGHVGRVLAGAALMAHEVAVRQRTVGGPTAPAAPAPQRLFPEPAARPAQVILHCSDGWDRTAQLCALAQLSLDPYRLRVISITIGNLD
jgi:hypothetical protein